MLEEIMEQSTSDVQFVKKVVMNKYRSLTFLTDDEDEDDMSYPQTSSNNLDEDSEYDTEELIEIHKRKTEQEKEMMEKEDIEAMLRALNPNMESEDEDISQFPIRQQSMQKWTELRMKQQEEEMAEAIAQLVADDRMS